ncbi:hypothetical protein IWGMT90018_34300 [Mycobacterium kiyosense]|nr:hypothetical protein IWGMT90018_34300 [Mycobacterium kiyosense]
MPEKAVTDPGNWLLIRTSEAADMLATQLTDALKVLDAQCTTLSWSFTDDHATCAQRLRGQLESGSFAGVVLLTATPSRARSGSRGSAASSTSSRWCGSPGSCPSCWVRRHGCTR